MLIAYIYVPGNAPGNRMGLVKFGEAGYYHCDYDRASLTDEEVKTFVADLNARLEVPAEVAAAAMAGSMFGWHVPAASAATEYENRHTDGR